MLDSLNNYDTTTGKYRAIDDPARDHRFVGAVVNKLVYEPLLNPANGRPIAYAAVGQGTATTPNIAGLYRSMDGGRSWTMLFQGRVDDYVLAAGSQLPNSGGRPTIAYMAVEGDSVYRTVQLNGTSPTFTKMLGGNGRPTVFGPVGTDAPADVPNGNKSKIVLAVPDLIPGDPLANNYYQRWSSLRPIRTLKYTVLRKQGRRRQWTQIILPAASTDSEPSLYRPGSNEFDGDHDRSERPKHRQRGIARIDTTFVNDPYNFSMYQTAMWTAGLSVGLRRVV